MGSIGCGVEAGIQLCSHLQETGATQGRRTMKKTWNKPAIQHKPAGMEVTAYVNPTF